MNLYLISQSKNSGYDTFDSAVVCAKDEEGARNTLPDERLNNGDLGDEWVSDLSQVEVKYIGEAGKGIKEGVICASYNAG